MTKVKFIVYLIYRRIMIAEASQKIERLTPTREITEIISLFTPSS